jgi:hypothetical protein
VGGFPHQSWATRLELIQYISQGWQELHGALGSLNETDIQAIEMV